MVRRARAGAVALVVCIGVVGCGGVENGEVDPAPGATSSTSTSAAPSRLETAATTSAAPTSTTTAAASPEEAEIIAAVLGYWDTILAANSPPNPEHPDLEKYATGEAFDITVSRVATFRDLGQAVRLPLNSVRRHSPVVVRVEGVHAVVHDCGIDDAVIYDRNTGEVLNDVVETIGWVIEVRKVEEDWKVERANIHSRSQGIGECDF